MSTHMQCACKDPPVPVSCRQVTGLVVGCRRAGAGADAEAQLLPPLPPQWCSTLQTSISSLSLRIPLWNVWKGWVLPHTHECGSLRIRVTSNPGLMRGCPSECPSPSPLFLTSRFTPTFSKPDLPTHVRPTRLFVSVPQACPCPSHSCPQYPAHVHDLFSRNILQSG